MRNITLTITLVTAMLLTGCSKSSSTNSVSPTEVSSETTTNSNTEAAIADTSKSVEATTNSSDTQTEIWQEITTENSTEIKIDNMTASNVIADDFVGEWEYENYFLTIWQNDDEYFAYMLCIESTEVYESWEYPLQYKDGKLICNEKGSKWDIDETKWDTQMITATYLNQSAEFSMSADGIVWNDLTGNIGDKIVFKFVQSID